MQKKEYLPYDHINHDYKTEIERYVFNVRISANNEKISANIYAIEDEYFLIELYKGEDYIPDEDDVIGIFKCDQFEGLLKKLKEIKDAHPNKKCKSCKGTRICPDCNGTGFIK